MATTRDDGVINPFPELPAKAGFDLPWKFTIPAGHMVAAQVRPDPTSPKRFVARIFDGNTGEQLAERTGLRATFASSFMAPFQTKTEGVARWTLDVDWRDYRIVASQEGVHVDPGTGVPVGDGGSTTPIGDPNPKGIFNLPFDFHPGDNFSVNIWERNDTTKTLNRVRFHVLVYSTTSTATSDMVTMMAPPSASGYTACKNPLPSSAGSDVYPPGTAIPTGEMYLIPNPTSGNRTLLPGQTLTANLPGWIAGPSTGNLAIQISLLCNELAEAPQIFPLIISGIQP